MNTTDIEGLIPHRYPFLFVDEIISATTEEIIAVKTFDDSNSMLKGSFPEMEYVPGTIILESMAQAGGAGVRLLGVADGIFALVQIESAQFLGGVHYNEPVKYVIKNLRLSEKIIRQSGQAFAGDKLVLEASWMSVKMSEKIV